MTTMEANNIFRYKVLEALGILSHALGPIVAKMLSDNGFSRYEANGRISPTEDLASTGDVSQVLAAMLSYWREVFEPLFGYPDSQRVRSLVFQVREVRKTYEGHPSGDYSYSDEALVDIRRLLEAFSAHEAEQKVHGLRQELTQLMMNDSPTEPSAPVNFGLQTTPVANTEHMRLTTKVKMPNEAGKVEQAIRQHCADGDVLPTPSGRSSFRIISIDASGMRILAGNKILPLIPWDALENVIPYLMGRTNTKIGAVHQSTGEPGTLDVYFKTTVSSTMVSSYVAAVFVKAGVVEYVHTKAMGVRLLPHF